MAKVEAVTFEVIEKITIVVGELVSKGGFLSSSPHLHQFLGFFLFLEES